MHVADTHVGGAQTGTNHRMHTGLTIVQQYHSLDKPQTYVCSYAQPQARTHPQTKARMAAGSRRAMLDSHRRSS
jgi:hypothetical protein